MQKINGCFKGKFLEFFYIKRKKKLMIFFFTTFYISY